MPHEWHIAEREYRRHESRRGRRHAFDTIVPERTALVVVDMVPFFVGEPSLPTARDIVPVIAGLADELRRLGGTVAWVVPGADEPTTRRHEFYGSEVAERYAGSGGSGPLHERVWHEFSIDRGDLVVEKTGPSAFFPGRCDLHELLRERGIDTVLITGTLANVCCESTTRDAATLDYRTIMIADANAAGSDEVLNATLHTIYRSFGDVRPAAEVIQQLSVAVDP